MRAFNKSGGRAGVLGLLCLLAVGCAPPVDHFTANRVFVKRMELESNSDLDLASADVQAILERLFGTPDAPTWPDFLSAESDVGQLVSVERLQRAAGPVSSDEQDRHFGLYRKHCIACHGTSGDGLGPVARLLNPYPRDFRLGKFKTKSTPLGVKPTREDLKRTIRQGIPGTSMASFALLKEDDIEALVDYVIYLSLRGQIERSLLTEAAFNVDYPGGERLVDLQGEASDADEFAEQWSLVEREVERQATRWAEASHQVPEVTGPPQDFPIYGPEGTGGGASNEQLAASVERGRQLFQGPVASCARCHGMTAMGDGLTQDYDDWTKDWSILCGLDPQDKQALQPMLALGALKPRNILPRDLRSGIYRGGGRPLDLYYRIVHGIEGTPMPAIPLQPDNPLGLNTSQVWDLVNYLLSLPQESLSLDLQGSPTSQQESGA